jgi:ribosomal RNA-processing protein 8
MSSIRDLYKKKKKNERKRVKRNDNSVVDTHFKRQRRVQSNAVSEKFASSSSSSSSSDSSSKLTEKFREKLQGGQFRWLNEQLYTQRSSDAFEQFQESPELFDAYHVGFRVQVQDWPVHPLDLFIERIGKMSKDTRVADFGAGDARLASTLKRRGHRGALHSFDLCSHGNELVTAADMANVPIGDASVDVAVFCLSLMGTNVADFVAEAHRVLVGGAGTMFVAEVRSRFETCPFKQFQAAVEQIGFTFVERDVQSNKMFVTFVFKKASSKASSKAPSKASSKANERKTKLPTIQLKACQYKKR